MNKDKRIKAELDKLTSVFFGVPAGKKKTVDNLIQNASFMAITLQDLQKQINEEGAIVTSTNGNGFETTSEHPAQKSYNTMINRYSAVIKQLVDLVPEEAKQNSKLSDFLND